MLNRPVSLIRSQCDRPHSVSESIDQRPNLRLVVLFLAFAVATGAVALRLAHVQTTLGDSFAAEFERTLERHEPIASRDGRILAADGQVLAEDIEEFALRVHYRWIEEPPDPVWLRHQALAQLDRTARRDISRIAAAEAAIVQRRADVWQRLAQLPGINSGDLTRRRRDVQQKVERIYQGVLQRRAEREVVRMPGAVPSRGWQNRAWQTIVSTLTTPPRREVLEPLVIEEQLDYHRLLEKLPPETAVEIEAHPERYPGARIEVCTRRVYPQGETAAHLIGFRAPLDDLAIKERRAQGSDRDPLDYQPGDRLGRTGLERFYERHLHGLRGERRVVWNRRGEVLQSELVREPRYGRDLVLSLQLPVQQAAEQLLDEALAASRIDDATGKPLPVPPGGAIVALDVRTGAVVAAASAPRFDAALPAEPDERWGAAVADPRKPLFHRAAEMALPPGSTFKIVSAVALLESGRIDPERNFYCQGFLDTPERHRCLTFRSFGVGHGELNLVGALARSCNVYFFSGARKIGAEPLVDWATRFGFGQPTGIDLPMESAGTLPRSTGTTARGPGFRSGDALQMAIGQGELTATPLQVARAMAAVANGGRLVTPRLVDSLGAMAAGDSARESPSVLDGSAVIRDLSPGALQHVRLGLQQVVAHPQGTGYKTVRLPGVSIAGKTGTAESGGGRPDHAWFAGYAPAERPKIAFVVVLEQAGSGGHAAGPLARDFVQGLVALGVLKDDRTAPPLAN